MLVKICGIKDRAALDAASQAGADMLGFVFFPPSPRAVTPAEAAMLARSYAAGPKRVGLFVDPDDALLTETLAQAPLDLIQLHGEESPARAADIRLRFGKPVMKALGIATKADLTRMADYADQVDYFLLDARPRFVDFDLYGMLGNFLASGHYRLPAPHARLHNWHERMSKVRLADFPG